MIHPRCVIKYKWLFAIGQQKKNNGNNYSLKQISHHQAQLQENRKVDFTTAFQVGGLNILNQKDTYRIRRRISEKCKLEVHKTLKMIAGSIEQNNIS